MANPSSVSHIAGVLYLYVFSVFVINCSASETHGELEQTISHIVKTMLKDNDDMDSSSVKTLERKLQILDEKVRMLEARDKHRVKVIERLIGETETLKQRCPCKQEEHNISDQDHESSKDKTSSQNGTEQILSRPGNAAKCTQPFDTRISFVSRADRAVRRSYHQIAFSAYMEKTKFHVSDGYKVVCNRVIINDGNAFNVRTGYFTVPVDGVYMLTFNFVGSLTYSTLTLLVDGNHVVGGVADATDSLEMMGGNTVVVALTTGQAVWLAVQQSTGAILISSDDMRLVTFSGLLLY